LLRNRRNAALLACFGVVCGLLLLELAVRLIEPREVLREFFEGHDPVLHHKFIAGARGWHKTLEFEAAYAINSLGLRNKEITCAKPPGTQRILMLGDSFTEGNGVQESETFSSRLQWSLDQARLGMCWQVINAGVGSYSPLLELLYLKNGGLELQPDLVVLNLDLSDIYDDIRYAQLAKFDATGDPLAVPAEREQDMRRWPIKALVGVKDLAKKHTRLYNFTRRRMYRYLGSARKPDLSGDVRVDKYGMLREHDGPCDDRGWGLSYEYILRIRDLLSATGIDFWVTVYPYGNQTSPREWSKGRVYWGFEPGSLASTRPQSLVVDFCRRNSIHVVNMCDGFREAAQSVYPLYYEWDGHWTAAGHQVAADVLNRELLPYCQARDSHTLSHSRGLGQAGSTG